MFEGQSVRDTRANFRQSASEPWRGSVRQYVDSYTFSNRRPHRLHVRPRTRLQMVSIEAVSPTVDLYLYLPG